MTQANYAEAVRLIKLGRRAEKRGAAVRGCLSAFLGTVLNFLIDGWFGMLAVGVIHGEWLRSIPTLGYWWAALIVWLIRGALTPPKIEPRS